MAVVPESLAARPAEAELWTWTVARTKSPVEKDLDGEDGLGLPESEEFVQVADVGVRRWYVGDGREVAVKGETEWTADGGDTADDVGAVDGGGVPGVDGAVDGFDGDLGIARALCDGDGDGFLEEPEEPFDDDGFMVPSEGWLAGQVEGCAHGFEVAKEGGAGVGGNEKAEANAEEDLFHECSSECGRVEGDDFCDDGEAGEVAHGGKEVLGAVVCRDGAGLPDVNVDDGKWGRYGPGVDEFTVLAGGGVQEDAVWTRALPGRDVKAESVPVEPKADAMEGLEVSEVAGGGR
eukprot:scaffold42357_cov221-Amphora_coffeaeformis.AAC.1